MRSTPAPLALMTVATTADAARPDIELVEACAAGEVTALGQLFDRHHRRVHGFVTRLVGRHADVDDLVQATFLEVLGAAPRFKGKSQVSTWIMAIAANLVRSAKRSSKKTTNDEIDVADDRPDPRQHAAERQAVARLEQALERLPHLLREAFVLCDLEQVRCVDAAKLLGVPEGTLNRRLHEARAKLRAAVGGAR